MTDEKHKMEVIGLVSARDGMPYVEISLNGERIGLMPVDVARAHASLVVEAAANATYEAAMFSFLQEELKLAPEQAAETVRQMRVWRADGWGQPEAIEEER